MKGLSMEQIQFMDVYLRDFNLDDAKMDVDISDKEVQEALEHSQVKELIEREQAFRFRKLGITPTRTLLHIAEVAYKKPCILVQGDEFYDEREAALGVVDTKEQTKALELLCKYQEVLEKGPKGKNNEEILGKIATVEEGLSIAKRLMGVN
jgi:hypothetical protein